METSVKERLKAEVGQAQAQGKQRASRIAEILKSAAIMTFEEVKEGSSEFNVVARQSAAEILETLERSPETAEEGAEVSTNLESADQDVEDSAEVQTEADEDLTSAPTWKVIVRNAMKVVRDRRGDWFQSAQQAIYKDAGRFDQEMIDKYGDRYVNLKTILQRLIAQVKPEKVDAAKASQAEPYPVKVEIVEGDSVVDVTPTAQSLDAEQ